MQYSADLDEAREMAREQRQYNKVCERFRVLNPAQIEDLFEKMEDPATRKATVAENGSPLLA